MYYKVISPNLDLLTDEVTRLSTLLKRTESGNVHDVRTPLGHKEERTTVVNKGLKVLDSHKAALPGRLHTLEIDQVSKTGRFSAMFPFAERKPDVTKYYEDIHLPVNVDKDVGDRAVSEYCKVLGPNMKHRLRPKSYKTVYEHGKKNTNSGLPYFTRRSEAIDDDIKLAESGQGKGIPAILFGRGQPTDKQRVIFGMPQSTNLVEGSIYQAITEYKQEKNLNPALVSQEAVETGITEMFDSKPANQEVIVTDFVSMDSHYNEFGFKSDNVILKYLYQKQYHDLIDQVHDNMRNIPLVATTKEEFVGEHGMPSGSGGTNPGENNSHAVFQYYVKNLFNSEGFRALRLGDDGLMTGTNLSSDKLVKVIKDGGMESNTEKFFVGTDDTKYLQRYYHNSYRSEDGRILGVYPTVRALGRLLGQERGHNPDEWGPDMVAIRSISILENCSSHPLFKQFIDFVLEGDKFKLGLNIPGFFDNLVKLKERLEALGAYESYATDLQAKSILKFKTVQYLLDLKQKAR